MHKFLIRAASGIIYAAVIIFAILYGGWALWLMAIAFTIIGVCELDRMAIGFSRKTLPVFILDIVASLSLLAVVVSKYSIIVYIAVMTIRYLIAPKKAPAYTPFYIGIPFLFMICDPIQRMPLLIFAMLWLNDSGAYIVGSLIGKHKLCPSVSPKKTWEGFLGGVAITLAGTFLFAEYCPGLFGMVDYKLWIWLLLGLSTCIFGTIGDLIESKIKRTYGFKDSGNWIPGHGGLLDRIDSFLIAYPVAFILLYFL